MKKFQGTGVAIVTPFKADMSVDYPALEKLVRHLQNGGVEFLVVQGTTGESLTLDKAERQEILSFVKELNANKLPIVLGHGGNDTKALIEALDEIDFDGVDAILSVSPYYNKPTQTGIYKHYKMLSEACPVDIILYNVPGRTASNIAWQTTMSLAKDFENIIGTKEAAGDLEQVAKVINNSPEDFLVLSGDDALSVPHMAMGGDGVISVIANAFPAVFSDMLRHCLNNRYSEARKNYYRLNKLIDLIFAEGNPGGIKAVLDLLEIGGQTLRPPLVSISNELEAAIQKEVSQIVA